MLFHFRKEKAEQHLLISSSLKLPKQSIEKLHTDCI